jgi:tetratricopeptide (TPR) repeat protein
MRTHSIATLLFALGLPALALVPFAASAASGKGTKKAAVSASASVEPSPGASAGGKRRDPENVTGISEFMETCVSGNAKYVSRDFTGAIDLYRKAIQSNPKHPLGHYLLGEAQLAAGNIGEAEASWKQAELVADGRDPTLRARILFVLADIRERQKRWDDAKAAWRVYADWSAKYADAGVFPQSASSRQQVIDAMMKQDKAYDIVRQRIAETKDGGVFTDLNAPPKK